LLFSFHLFVPSSLSFSLPVFRGNNQRCAMVRCLTSFSSCCWLWWPGFGQRCAQPLCTQALGGWFRVCWFWLRWPGVGGRYAQPLCGRAFGGMVAARLHDSCKVDLSSFPEVRHQHLTAHDSRASAAARIA
jgi:hypothetical protein